MSKAKAAAPGAAADKSRPLHNVSDAALADLWGDLKPKLKKLEDRLDEVQTEFKLRGLVTAKGEKFVVVKSVVEYTQLDNAAIRAAMGEAWCAKHSKPGARTSYIVTPLA